MTLNHAQTKDHSTLSSQILELMIYGKNCITDVY